MEIHFPHLTNGITAPKPVKKPKLAFPVVAVALIAGLIYSIV